MQFFKNPSCTQGYDHLVCFFFAKWLFMQGDMMTTNELYAAFIHGGSFALPWLITLSHDTAGTIRLVNNNEDVEYDGETYMASTFDYSRPTAVGGVLNGGVLSVTAVDTGLVEFFDEADESFTFQAVGVYVDGEVTPVTVYAQKYATVAISGEAEITIEFAGDDRLDMVFPPYVFDAENNRGNA